MGTSPKRPILFGLMTVLLVAGIAMLAGCGANTVGQAPPTSTPLPPTATSVPPTATSIPVTCASVLPGAGPASAGTSFPDLLLPPNSVSTALTQVRGGGAGQFTIYELQLCIEHSSPAAVSAFFVGLTTHGWFHSNTFPADASFQSNCTDQYCWAKDVRYVSLEQPVKDMGNGVERYHLTLATAPPAPVCTGPNGSNPFPQGYYYWIPDPGYTQTHVYADIPLPPLSRIFPNDAAGGLRSYDICSAGTVASIRTFMNTYLSRLGWTYSGSPNNGSEVWTKDGYGINVDFTFGGYGGPTYWAILWRDPNFQ